MSHLLINFFSVVYKTKLTTYQHFFRPYDKPPSLEKQLIKDLMTNYTSIGINGRPIDNMSLPITVSFGLGLIQMDLNENDKILTTSMWSLYVSTKLKRCPLAIFNVLVVFHGNL